MSSELRTERWVIRVIGWGTSEANIAVYPGEEVHIVKDVWEAEMGGCLEEASQIFDRNPDGGEAELVVLVIPYEAFSARMRSLGYQKVPEHVEEDPDGDES